MSEMSGFSLSLLVSVRIIRGSGPHAIQPYSTLIYLYPYIIASCFFGLLYPLILGSIEEKDYRDVSKVVLPLLYPSMFTVTPNCTCVLFPLLVSFFSGCTDFVSCFFLHHATAHTMTMMMMNYNYLSL